MSIFDQSPLESQVGLLLVQLILILGVARILHQILRPLHQPMVIAEICGGIILGPSVLGQIPNFSETIFPEESFKYLNELAQLGLIFYLFMVGVNLDPHQIKLNWKTPVTASVFGFVLPFLVAIPLTVFLNQPKYTQQSAAVLGLFVGIALFISALAVFSRILSDRNLLHSQLATISCSASAIDTLVGIILMAVVLSASTKPGGKEHSMMDRLNPLWILICFLIHLVLLWFIVRPVLLRISWHVQKKGVLDTRMFFLLCVILFAVSWVTETIGISGTFGAFEVGLLLPRKGPLIRLVLSKVTDLVVGILLPVFFTISGLRTDFSLLAHGDVIGITILVVVAGWFSKFIGIILAGRALKMSWQECFPFGILMSTKGLVALVMFNLSLEYGVITDTLFTVMVTYVLITTFITTPLLDLSLRGKNLGPSKQKVAQFSVALVPHHPRFGGPMSTLANLLTSYDREKTKVTAIRLLNREEGESGVIMSEMKRHQLKHDTLVASAYQRASLLLMPIELRSLACQKQVEELVDFAKLEDYTIMVIGVDLPRDTHESEQLQSSLAIPSDDIKESKRGLSHLIDTLVLDTQENSLIQVTDVASLAQTTTSVAIFSPVPTLGIHINKVFIPFLDATAVANNRILVELAHKMASSSAEGAFCEVFLCHMTEMTDESEGEEGNGNSNQELAPYIALMNSTITNRGRVSLTRRPFSSTKELLRVIADEATTRECQLLVLSPFAVPPEMFNDKLTSQVIPGIMAQLSQLVLCSQLFLVPTSNPGATLQLDEVTLNVDSV